MIAAGYLVYLAGLAAAFGVRTWLQRRRTGSSGFKGISGRAGSRPWWAGVLFVLALGLGVTAPALTLAGATPASRLPGAGAPAVAGLVLLVVGVVAVLLSQTGMGASWRIGVDEGERTELVTDGVFAHVRNPVFTAMVLTQTGMAVIAVTAVSVAAVGCLVVAVHMQARVVEEPYLLRTHGRAYADYAARTGRFVPGVGRLDPRRAAER